MIVCKAEVPIHRVVIERKKERVSEKQFFTEWKGTVT
jgi:hypothetical protein